MQQLQNERKLGLGSDKPFVKMKNNKKVNTALSGHYMYAP